MTYIARSFDIDTIGPAWSFVLECEDDDPRGFGVDLLPAFPARRDGVFRQRSHADASAPSYDETARATEDALIAHLDGDLDEIDDAVFDEDLFVLSAEDAEDDLEPTPCQTAPDETAPEDVTEALPLHEGLGRRARLSPQVSLRRAALRPFG